MAYSGFFFKFGEFVFPNKYIEWDTYDSAPSQRLDLDSYTDANGVTHRNALEHTKTEIKFTTGEVWEDVWDMLMGGIEANYQNPKERDAYCTYYDFEKRDYKTGHFYLDPSFRVSANDLKGRLRYNKANWLFIEY